MQALLKDLQSSADAILPILCDEDRSILEDLESLGVDYIGSSAFAGSQAANKHKYRHPFTQSCITSLCCRFLPFRLTTHAHVML